MASCSLCLKKIGLLQASYTIENNSVCEDCKIQCDAVLDSLGDQFENALSIFQQKYNDSQDLKSFLRYFNEEQKKYISEKEKRKQEEENEARRIDMEKEAAEKRKRIAAEEAERKRLEEEKKKRAEKEAFQQKVDSLKKRGYEGYYEYKTIDLSDASDGSISAFSLTSQLNALALEGWRLVSAYTNELGHNSNSSSFAGISNGTNSTIDQHILILERFIKI